MAPKYRRKKFRYVRYRLNKFIKFVGRIWEVWLFVAMFLWLILSAFISEKVYTTITVILMLGIICCCDYSFIYDYIHRKILERSSKFKKFRKTEERGDYKQQVYKTVTYFFLLLYWAVPQMEIFALTGCLVLPIISIIQYITHQDEIRFGNLNEWDTTPTSMMLLITGGLLALNTVEEIAQYPIHFFVLWILCSLGIIVPFLIWGREHKNKKNEALSFIVCVVLFIFGMLGNINTVFDFSEGHKYQVEIIDKDMDSGRGINPSVYVSPWNAEQEETRIFVSDSEYRDAEIGETAYIYEKEGFLKMEWYYIEIK